MTSHGMGRAAWCLWASSACSCHLSLSALEGNPPAGTSSLSFHSFLLSHLSEKNVKNTLHTLFVQTSTPKCSLLLTHFFPSPFPAPLPQSSYLPISGFVAHPPSPHQAPTLFKIFKSISPSTCCWISVMKFIQHWPLKSYHSLEKSFLLFHLFLLPFRSSPSSPLAFPLTLQDQSSPLTYSVLLPPPPLSLCSGSPHRCMHKQKCTAQVQTGHYSPISMCPRGLSSTTGCPRSWCKKPHFGGTLALQEVSS